MIHMTSTVVNSHGIWHAVCRCGWKSYPLETRGNARRSGDDHLAATNGGAA